MFQLLLFFFLAVMNISCMHGMYIMEGDNDDWEQIALEDGIMNSNIDKVKRVLNYQNLSSKLDLDKALYQATFKYEKDAKGTLEIIKFLIEKGANINSQSKHGNTALHQYRNLMYPQLIEFMLTVPGINPTIRNKDNETSVDRVWISFPSQNIKSSLALLRNHILTKRMEHLKAKSELLQAVEKNDVKRAAYLMNKYPYFTKHYRDAEGVSLLRKAIESAGDSSDLVKHTIAVAPELLLIQDKDGRAPYYNSAIGQLMLLVIDDPTR